MNTLGCLWGTLVVKTELNCTKNYKALYINFTKCHGTGFWCFGTDMTSSSSQWLWMWGGYCTKLWTWGCDPRSYQICGRHLQAVPYCGRHLQAILYCGRHLQAVPYCGRHLQAVPYLPSFKCGSFRHPISICLLNNILLSSVCGFACTMTYKHRSTRFCGAYIKFHTASCRAQIQICWWRNTKD